MMTNQFARAIKRLLQVAGIKVDTFCGGDPFLKMQSSARSYRPACAVLDFEMPGINGLELQHHLAPTGVPVIFITTDDDPAVRETALASGAAACLLKPFDGEMLIKTVEIVLHSERGPYAVGYQFTRNMDEFIALRHTKTHMCDPLTTVCTYLPHRS